MVLIADYSTHAAIIPVPCVIDAVSKWKLNRQARAGVAGSGDLLFAPMNRYDDGPATLRPSFSGELLMVKLAAVSASALLMLLAGCNPAPVSAPEQIPAEVVVDEQPEVAPPQADPALPPGVNIAVPANPRSTHTYTTKAGQERRVVIYEFLEGDVAAMADTLERAMTDAGFSARREDDNGDGNTRITFIKPGYGRVNGSVTSSLGKKPIDASAKGMYSLDIPVTPDPNATASG